MIVPVKATPGVVVGVNSESLSPGALRQAAHMILRRPDLLEMRRSLTQLPESNYGGVLTGGVSALLPWQGTSALYAVSGAGVYKRAAGTWSRLAAFNGYVAAVGSYLRSAEMNGNLYFTCQNAVVRFAETAVRIAGMPRAPDPTISSGTGALLTAGQSVAYRVVWGTFDEQGRPILGSPSGRITFTAAGTVSVTVRAPLVSWTVSNTFFKVYRTATFATSVTPDDEMQLVFQGVPTTTDVANGYVLFVDSQPDGLRGEALYTNASQGGIGNAYMPPPVCRDLAPFNGCMFYGDVSQDYAVLAPRADVALLGIPTVYVLNGAGGQVQAATPGAGQATYTFTSAGGATYDFNGITTSMFLAVSGCTNAGNNGNFAVVSVDSANRKVVVTNNVAVNEAAPPAGAKAVCAAVVLRTSNVATTLYHAAWAEVAGSRWLVTDSGTVSQQIEATARSICRVTGGVYASSVSDAPGKMTLYATLSVFALGTPTGVGSGPGVQFSTKFAPDLTAELTTTSDKSVADVYWSKYNQPEHVSALNRLRIGSQSKAVLRLKPLRDSLLVWKEDGLWRITGDGTTFIATAVDRTLLLIDERLTADLHNEVYAVTTRGVVKVSDAGISPVSNGIHPLLQPILEGPTIISAHAEASEQDSVIYFYVRYRLTGATNDLAVQLIYNARTGAWTACDRKSLLAGHSDDSLLAMQAVTLTRLLYRHSTTAPDVFVENLVSGLEPPAAKVVENGMPLPGDGFNILCNAWTSGTRKFRIANTTATRLNATHSPAIGDVVRTQGTYYAYWLVTDIIVTPNGGGTPFNDLVLSPYLVDPADAAVEFASATQYVLFAGYPVTLEYNGATLGQPYSPKTFQRFALLLEEQNTAMALSFSFTTELDSTPEGATNAVQQFTVETDVPLLKQRANRLYPKVTHSAPAKFLVVEGYALAVDDPAGQSVS